MPGSEKITSVTIAPPISVPELQAEVRHHRDTGVRGDVPREQAPSLIPFARAVLTYSSRITPTVVARRKRVSGGASQSARVTAGSAIDLRFPTGSLEMGTYPPGGKPAELDREDDDQDRAR